jgi:ribonuclease P protein component
MQCRFRLRHSADFQRVRARGQRWHHPFVTMSIAPNELTHNRYGFVVSRRLGGAVVRNRTRRLLREAVRLSNARLKAGFDVVLIAHNPIVDQPYNKVDEAVGELFRRARLWGRIEETQV